MRAQLCACPYDHEADLLEAWCRRHGFDALTLLNGDGRAPEIWRDDQRAWWVLSLPDGGEVALLVGADSGNS
jgi:hypothetical protein